MSKEMKEKGRRETKIKEETREFGKQNGKKGETSLRNNARFK